MTSDCKEKGIGKSEFLAISLIFMKILVQLCLDIPLICPEGTLHINPLFLRLFYC